MTGPKFGSQFQLWTYNPVIMITIVNPILNNWYPVLPATNDARLDALAFEQFVGALAYEWRVTIDNNPPIYHLAGALGVGGFGVWNFYYLNPVNDDIQMLAGNVLCPFLLDHGGQEAHVLSVDWRIVAAGATTVRLRVRYSTVE